MLKNEYFVIDRENNDNNPLFSWDESSGSFGMGKLVQFINPIKMRLGEPVSSGFQWADYHKAPEPVVSSRIADVLGAMDLYGVQIVPVKVRDLKDTMPEQDYWFLHVWNRISCLDREQSDLDLYKDGSIFSIDEFVLDERELEKIELSKRLIFSLSEKTSVILVHQTVKDAMLSLDPTGVRFFEASKWNSDSAFE